MKIRILPILLAGWTISAGSFVHAEPERMAIKNPTVNARERTAAAQLKTISLSSIEDPAAQKAIEEIINYLGLQAQK
jgi:hypothetical protein